MGKLYDHQSYCLLKTFNKTAGEIQLKTLISDKLDDPYSQKDFIYAIGTTTMPSKYFMESIRIE